MVFFYLVLKNILIIDRPTGARFSGNFVDDFISGKGTLVWPQKDGKTVRRYEGLWRDKGIKGLVVEQFDTNEIKTFDLKRKC